MATSNNRDVKMTLSVETLGSDDIKKLRDSVASLAKEGGDAAPEFQRLADEIDRLGQQSDALQSFQKLADQTTDLTSRQGAAAAAAQELATRLEAATAVTRAAADAQRQTVAALEAARVAQRATRDELAALTATTSAADRAETGYAEAVERLKLAKIEQRAEVERLSDALRTSNAAVREAEQAEAKLEGTYNRAARAAAAAEAAINTQQAALLASAAAADALGVSTENLSTSQASVARGFTELQQRATTLTERLARLAEQERELEGIRAFQQQADDAKRLFDTASYADLFEQALSGVAAAEREVAAAQAALDWQREAEAIVNAAEATQRLARQQEIMLQVQRELANDRSMARQAEEAEKLARQADQIRLFTQRLDELEQQEKQTAEAAEQAGAKIRNAFGAVGVRSVEELRAEVAEVRSAMETLRSTAGVTGSALNQAFSAGNAKIKELERDIRAASGQLTLADRAANLFKNSLGQIAAGNIIADGVGYLVNKVKELGSAFVEVTMQTERMRKGLQAVYGSADVAARQFTFLRTTANASGVSITSISDAFLRFSAATKSANLPLNVTNDLFVAVTRAGATLGLTGEQVTGTLDALGQMASKGVVSMEELRQQLGDRLPGALSLAAKGLGITDQQLISLVESGQLATRDFFPAFTTGLKAMAGDTNTLTGAWQRFTNVLNEGAVAVGDAGGLTLLKLAVQGLTIAFGVVAVPVQGFIEVLNLATRGLGVFYEKLRPGGDGAKAQAEFQLEVEKSAARLTGLQNALDGAINGFGDSGAAAKSGAAGVDANAVAMGNNTSAVLANAVAKEKLAAGMAVASNAYVQQLVRLTENGAAMEAAVSSSEKLLKAKEDEGRALVLTAQLTGSASAALDANATAATNNALAAQQVVDARTREVAVTQSAINLVNAERDARGLLTSDRQAFLDKLTTQLTLQDAELERSRQSTIELGRQALAAQTAATAYADNSTKVDGYRTAMESAGIVAAILTTQVQAQTAALIELKDQLETGKITQEAYNQAKSNLQATTEALNRATGDAARFENLYRDAVADSVASVDRKARAQAANLSVTEALVKVQQAHYETLARQSKALGDEAMATYYSVEAKMKQIEAIKLATEIKNLELQADKAAIEIQIAALDPQDQLYQQKKQELEIRLQIIEAKRIEASASREVVKGIEDEITAMRNKAAMMGGSVNVIGGAPPAPAPAGSRGTPPPPPGAPPAPGRNKDGSMSGTFTNLTPLDKATAVLNNRGRNAYGVDDIAFLQEAKKQADDAKAWLDSMVKSGGGTSISAEAWRSAQGLQVSTRNALDTALRLKQGQETQAAAAGAARSGATGAPAGLNTTHSLVIDLGGGKRGTFQMASENDASGLSALLSQLGNAKRVN